jgi:hypothetical protein
LTSTDDDSEELVVETIDKIGNFYRGVVCKLHRSPERGKVRTASGREIPFTFAHVTMVGVHRRFEELHEGMEVGYDLGWTAKGLRVHAIWIPDDAGTRPQSEGQGSAEKDETAHHLPDQNSQNGDVK